MEKYAYAITTDSTVDLGLERMKELGVPFVHLYYTHNGTEYQDDMSEKSAKFIYDSMRAGTNITTSQAVSEEFIQIWSPILEGGRDVVYVGFSSGLSGTVNSATIAMRELMDRYPDRRIYIVDSLCASGGEGMLLLNALRMREEGLAAKECANKLEELKLYINHWFTVGELAYLKRGGRVSNVAAFVADILNIKPVLNMDCFGHLIPREKVKGRKSSIKRMFQHMDDEIDIERTTFVHITHSDCMDDALYLKSMILERFPKMPVNISTVGAVIGAHSGPGTLALFFIGNKRTT